MKKLLKKSICILLTLALALSAMSLFSFASTPTAYDSALISDGKIISNTLYPSTYRYGTIEHSYIQANSDNTLSRITSSNGSVYIDTYTADFEYINSKTIENVLPIFGGFYSGSEYNFCIFGQNNPDECDKCEVFKIVKYSKNWEELGSATLEGANTYIPFDAGSARMYESNGNLYIHTCHEMYASEDGKHHQANVQIHIEIESMEIFYSFYDIMNIGYGYCSHSFDQYIRSDGDYVYTVDHGDAHLRSVTICQKYPSGKMIKYTEALKIYGESGDNTTGVTLGGFEISDSTLIIAGNTSSQQEGQDTSVRNIFVTVTDKELNENKFIQLTNFNESGKVSKPQLVKIDNNQFIVMWNEFETANYSSDFTKMCAVMIDSQGNTLERIETNAMVSDCDPIVTDGKLVWYNNNAFYSFEIDRFSDYNGYNSNIKTYGDYEYIKYSNGVIITAYNGDDSYIRVPQEIDGIPVVSIGDEAFAYNQNLQILVLPDTLKTIGDSAFYNCKYLKHIYIPDGVTTVGSYAFAYCYYVTYLVLPKSVKSIGYYGFFTSSLDDIYYEGSESDWQKLDTSSAFCTNAKKAMHYNCNPDYYHFDFGDVNLDDKFTSQDALLVLQHTTGLRAMSAGELKRADVSKDGNINSSDALLLLQRATGIIKSF